MEVDYAQIGRLLGSRARSAMLAALLEGPPMTAGSLARRAKVAPSTASEHLGTLVDGGLVSVAPSGRQRHYRLANAEVAGALETLGRVCRPVPVRSLRASEDAAAFGFARTCYDHLAGELGVGILDALLLAGWLVPAADGFAPGPHAAGFRDVGVVLEELNGRRRPFAPPCLDATVGRQHLAGSLGAALCDALLDRRWLIREASRRGLRVSAEGAAQLSRRLPVDPSLLARAGPR